MSSLTGVITAMHDAAALANWICSLIFKEYCAERLSVGKAMFVKRQSLNNIGGKVRSMRNIKYIDTAYFITRERELTPLKSWQRNRGSLHR